ncbi:MAG: hypothetical protein JXA67_17445, partial [Micromonosporaceae bacterium]|nr:hypothetical protein [Micromonosporaceae bacterium]
DEIAVITRGDFLAEATAAMASLDPAAKGKTAEDRARLLWLSGINQLDMPFPPPQPLHAAAEDDSQEAHLRSKIIGVGYTASLAARNNVL